MVLVAYVDHVVWWRPYLISATYINHLCVCSIGFAGVHIHIDYYNYIT